MIHQPQQFLNLMLLQIHSWILQEPMLKYICFNIGVTELLKLKPLHRIWWDIFASVPKVWWAFVLAQVLLSQPLLCSLVVVAYIFLWVPPKHGIDCNGEISHACHSPPACQLRLWHGINMLTWTNWSYGEGSGTSKSSCSNLTRSRRIEVGTSKWKYYRMLLFFFKQEHPQK